MKEKRTKRRDRKPARHREEKGRDRVAANGTPLAREDGPRHSRSIQNPTQQSETRPSDEEIKRASDARRAARKKQHILIHGDHIEDLDERDRREQAEAVEVKETGYRTRCRIVSREDRWNWLRRAVNGMVGWMFPEWKMPCRMKYVRRVELKRKFVEMRMVTRCVHLFHDPKRDKMYLQCPELQMMQRTSIAHVERFGWWWLRRYGYYATLDMTPEPSYVMLLTGVNPDKTRSQEYDLVEEDGKCRYMGVTKVYRMEPVRSRYKTPQTPFGRAEGAATKSQQTEQEGAVVLGGVIGQQDGDFVPMVRRGRGLACGRVSLCHRLGVCRDGAERGFLRSF